MPNAIRDLIIALGLVAVTLVPYAQVREFSFVNLDDDQYVVDNPLVREGITPDGVRWALTSRHAATWHPVTTLSHMLDCEIFGLDAGSHHLVNVALHALGSVLLFRALAVMTAAAWPSALAAALFALHPLHVESVAWISERKDVLSGVFFFLTLLAYARFARGPTVGRYLLVAAVFAAGLLSKPMLVTVPFVLMLLDGWPLRRVKASSIASLPASGDARRSAFFAVTPARAVAEKLPLLAMSAGVGAVTVIAQRDAGAMDAGAALPLAARIAAALVAYVSYLGDAFFPARLAVFYPFRAASPTEALACAAVLALLSAGAVVAFRRFPYLLVGWLWYVGMLIPVIGLIPVGEQAMADRYAYLPLVGIFVALAWGAADLAAAWPRLRVAIALAATAALVACVALAHEQVSVWRNDETLFRHALEANGPSYLAHTNLGVAYLRAGRFEPAGAQFREALRLRPDFPPAHLNLAMALEALKDPNEALRHFLRAIELDPSDAVARYHAALEFARREEHDFAIAQLEAALALRPDDARIRHQLARSLRARHRDAEAIEQERAAVALAPDFAAARNELAILLEDSGQREEAIAQYREVVRLLPDDFRVRLNLAAALAAAGRRAEANAELEEAERRWPDQPDVRSARAAAGG